MCTITLLNTSDGSSWVLGQFLLTWLVEISALTVECIEHNLIFKENKSWLGLHICHALIHPPTTNMHMHNAHLYVVFYFLHPYLLAHLNDKISFFYHLTCKNHRKKIPTYITTVHRIRLVFLCCCCLLTIHHVSMDSVIDSNKSEMVPKRKKWQNNEQCMGNSQFLCKQIAKWKWRWVPMSFNTIVKRACVCVCVCVLFVDGSIRACAQ